MKKASLPCALLITALAAQLHARTPMQSQRASVWLGGDENLDACTAHMRIKPDRAKPGALVPVRKTPAATAPILYWVKPGKRVWACDHKSSKPRWTGIVYEVDAIDEEKGCGVTSPIATYQIYNGRCASGWVPDASLGW